MNKIFCVISHTHWDREWYMPFEQFRMRLVDLMDNLLDIMEAYPEYIFHLDAQTIVLEDYLEIRPYRRELLEKHIREGRILVGPWYVQNDFFLTSGEATIRNLNIGSGIAGNFGKCERVGYAPDQFGLISQLPQILNGFGIESCIFGRGYNFVEKVDGVLKPKEAVPEFFWECEDGSEVLAVHMPFWYNNAQRFSEDIDKALKYLEYIEKSFEGLAITPYLLLMNGVDHLEAQENLLPILRRMNERLPEGKRLVQTTMQEYTDKVREYVEKTGTKDSVKIYRGEMRTGVDLNILQGTLSSRVYLKAENVKAQNLLENCLEPVYSFMLMLGAESKYPSDYMTWLWKLLIRNHPHDSICGCSRDAVHDHMEDRFKRINEAGSMLLERGMDFISAHVSREALTDNDYLITLFNTVESSRNAVVELELQFPADENVENFTITDSDGRNVQFAVLSKQKKNRIILSPINLPGNMVVDCFRIQLYAAIGGLGYRTFAVRPRDGKISVIESTVAAEAPVLENEHIKATIHRDGRIDLLNKATGALYGDMLIFEDSGDCGDSYVYKPADGGEVFTSRSVTPGIKCLRKTGLEDAYELTYDLLLPACFDKAAGKRSESLASNTVRMALSLKKGSKNLDIAFDIDNASEDHRLRILVNTGISGDYSEASTPFDIIRRDRRDVLKEINNGTQPDSGFINLEDDNGKGIAVLTEGMQEYEHLMEDGGIIAVTLLRANGFIFLPADSSAAADETWIVPGNQCKRNIKLKMALYPHSGGIADAGAALAAREFQNPVLSYFQPADIRKFTGGRPCVQDSEIKEIFFRPDPFAHIILPRDSKLVDMRGKGIVLSALKKAEKDNSLIIRVYNSSSEEREFELSFFKTLTGVQKVSMREEAIKELEYEGNGIKPVMLKPKEIYTIKVKMEDINAAR